VSGTEASYLPFGLAKGSKISVTYYQPKLAEVYAGIPRFNAGDVIMATALGMEATAESWEMSKICLIATLTSASSLILPASLLATSASLM
jgi:hypothetical protein